MIDDRQVEKFCLELARRAVRIGQPGFSLLSRVSGLQSLVPVLSVELHPVVVTERISDDALQVLPPSASSRAVALTQTRLRAADGLAPQNVHGALPAREEKLCRQIESVCHKCPLESSSGMRHAEVMHLHHFFGLTRLLMNVHQKEATGGP